MLGKHRDRIFISVMVATQPVKDFDNVAMWEGVVWFACSESLGVHQSLRRLILFQGVSNGFIVIWHQAYISANISYQRSFGNNEGKTRP
jgi:hypothetical protein